MNDEVQRTEEIAPESDAPAPAEPVAETPVDAPVETVETVETPAESEVVSVDAPAADLSSPDAESSAEAEESAPADTVGEPVAEEPSGSQAEAASNDEPTLEELEALVDDTEPEVAPSGPLEIDVPEDEEIKLDWYILKVQSNRERSIADSLRRKIAIEGLDSYFGQVLVPTEKVTEFKGGKKKIVERKIWPGYIAVEMHVNDDTWFAIRETSGIGDFTGSAGKPSPMQPHEIAMILPKDDVADEPDEPKLDIKFKVGDKVKVMEGNFENFEGELSSIDQAHGKVTVMLSIFGRPTPVELEYWQVETV